MSFSWQILPGLRLSFIISTITKHSAMFGLGVITVPCSQSASFTDKCSKKAFFGCKGVYSQKDCNVVQQHPLQLIIFFKKANKS